MVRATVFRITDDEWLLGAQEAMQMRFTRHRQLSTCFFVGVVLVALFSVFWSLNSLFVSGDRVKNESIQIPRVKSLLGMKSLLWSAHTCLSLARTKEPRDDGRLCLNKHDDPSFKTASCHITWTSQGGNDQGTCHTAPTKARSNLST